jgi:hypothetical protein
LVQDFLSASGRQVGTINVRLLLDQPLHLWRQSDDVVMTDYQDLAEKLETGQITLFPPTPVPNNQVNRQLRRIAQGTRAPNADSAPPSAASLLA